MLLATSVGVEIAIEAVGALDEWHCKPACRAAALDKTGRPRDTCPAVFLHRILRSISQHGLEFLRVHLVRVVIHLDGEIPLPDWKNGTFASTFFSGGVEMENLAIRNAADLHWGHWVEAKSNVRSSSV